jgi:tetratricopeptide (TPR) repeat protein
MQAERINFLIEQIKIDPEDPFNHYALAIEYLQDQPQKSLEYFEKLLINSPEYLPTYYHAANLFFTFEKIKEAKDTYLKGIELATNLKKEKTLKELQGAYSMFLDEIDE